ncbi:MAG: Beta-galactosidase BoGH2A [Candidatus Ordinivivax streblomastigis]|uniref:Beta-galactosidase BoGH2A n=1 Tax=Candidatus Ordinivivax streblomastigis TaxID=2540710 RepID=A0A5M8NTQ7_9BACT|nr:MAG: Beta-galactosidase BoGH2A [Candidatus Ordinivivax streblomastigis]
MGRICLSENGNEKNAILSVEVEIENGSNSNDTLTVNNELISFDGKIVAKSAKKITVATGQTTKFTADLTVHHPQLWTLDHPRLYQLKTTVWQAGKVIDETTTRNYLLGNPLSSRQISSHRFRPRR